MHGRGSTQPAVPNGAGAVDDDPTWDVGAGLPVTLVGRRTQGGVTTTTKFVYGLGLISTTDNAGVASYYLADGLGSTTQLVDSSGAVANTYTYDAFGAPRTVTGATPNDFRFTGQQTDAKANRGLYYLRARHYDPALGRFLGRDPVPFAQRYAYVGNNPANATDPFGLCPWYELCDVPIGIPIPYWPPPEIDAPGDLGLPDIEFNTDIAENWRRHIDWAKKKLGGGRREAPPQGTPRSTGLDSSRWYQPQCWKIPDLRLQVVCYTGWLAGGLAVAKTLNLDVILKDLLGNDDKETSSR